jgi:hypothetical protein
MINSKPSNNGGLIDLSNFKIKSPGMMLLAKIKADRAAKPPEKSLFPKASPLATKRRLSLLLAAPVSLESSIISNDTSDVDDYDDDQLVLPKEREMREMQNNLGGR